MLSELRGDGVRFRQKLRNQGNTEYIGNISLGGQVINGLFDTGSFETMVTSTKCTESCKNAPYNASKSTTYVKGPMVVKKSVFGSGPVWSVQSYENVTLGPLSIANFNFQEIVQHTVSQFECPDDTPHCNTRLEGVIGIGPGPKNRKKSEDVPLMDAFNITWFSICLQHGPSETEPGWIIWNDHAPTGKSHFTEIQVVGKVHWGVQLEAVAFDGHPFLACHESAPAHKESALDSLLGAAPVIKHSCGAVVDSGTSLIAAPSSSIGALKKMLKELNPNCENLADMPDLQFSLGGKNMSVPPSAYIARLNGTMSFEIWDLLVFKPVAKVKQSVTQCVPLFINLDQMGLGRTSQTQWGPLWIMGMPFFRKYYTTFNFVERKMFVAEADSACEAKTTPGATSMMEERRSMQPLTIDASKLRLPRIPEGF